MILFKEFETFNFKLFEKYHCVGYCVGPVFAVTWAPRAGSGQGPGGARAIPGSTLFPSTFLGEGWELSVVRSWRARQTKLDCKKEASTAVVFARAAQNLKSLPQRT